MAKPWWKTRSRPFSYETLKVEYARYLGSNDRVRYPKWSLIYDLIPEHKSPDLEERITNRLPTNNKDRLENEQLKVNYTWSAPWRFFKPSIFQFLLIKSK